MMWSVTVRYKHRSSLFMGLDGTNIGFSYGKIFCVNVLGMVDDREVYASHVDVPPCEHIFAYFKKLISLPLIFGLRSMSIWKILLG